MKKLLILAILLVAATGYSQSSKFKSVVLKPTEQPINPSEGEMYYSSTDNLSYIYNGTSWEIFSNASGLVSLEDSIALVKTVFNWEDSTAILTEAKIDSLTVSGIRYSNTYWDDLRVPMTNTRINPANSEPDFEDRGDGMFAWGFDAGSDSTWVSNFTAQTPHERADSTFMEAHIHWQPDGTNTGSVVWKLIYSVANINGTWTATDTLRIVDPADGVTLKYQIAGFGTIAGSDTLRISAGIVGSLGRMGDAPDDTYTGTAYAVEIDFHYQINAPGSQYETSKY